MNEETGETTPQIEEVTTVPEVVEVETPDTSKELQSALAQKDHYRAKFEKAEADRKVLEAKLKSPQGAKPALDVEDYIDISASLEGLDQREKEYLAQQHKLSGLPLGEIRKDENFSLWQTAYQQKREKENGLKPSGTQPDVNRVQSFEDRLANATTIAEKEKLLSEAGLYTPPKTRTDVRNIGTFK